MTKDVLKDLISRKEIQLERAKLESDCWNNGKYKNSSHGVVSKIFVNSIQKEIESLNAKLSELES